MSWGELHPNKEADSQINADSSPVELGVVLVQEKNGERCAVCYASRTLTPVECRYSQTEKEALAFVWACDRFHLHVYGMPKFELVTDHKALMVIACIERWVLHLQPYNYQGCYVPSIKNIAYALSRLTKIEDPGQSHGDDEYIRMITSHATPVALKIKEIKQMSAQDPELQVIRK